MLTFTIVKEYGRVCQNSQGPKNEDDLKNEHKLKNEDDLKKEDSLKNEDDLENEEDLRNEDRTRPKLTQLWLRLLILMYLLVPLTCS